MNPQWLDNLKNKIDEIISSDMDDYFYRDADEFERWKKTMSFITNNGVHIDVKPISPKNSKGDSEILSSDKYLITYVLDTSNAYRDVSADQFFHSLASEFMQSYGFTPESYCNSNNKSQYDVDVLRIFEDAYKIFTYEYIKLYINALSTRHYALNNGSYPAYSEESYEQLRDTAISLGIDPEDIFNPHSPFVFGKDSDGFTTHERMNMLFSLKRYPFVELAKKYELFDRGRVTGYNLNKVAGYGRRNFEAIFDPKNRHTITPGQMFAICLICKMSVKETITFFHECKELGELTDYPIPAAVLINMLAKKCYDYETFLKLCCETFKTLGEELPDYLASNSLWKETFEQQ